MLGLLAVSDSPRSDTKGRYRSSRRFQPPDVQLGGVEFAAAGFGGNPTARGADWIAERYSDRLLLYPLNGYQKTGPCSPGTWRDVFYELIQKGLSQTHGLPSAIAFLYLNDALRSFPIGAAPPRRRFCVEWAAMAIMMHDLGKLYGKAEKASPGKYTLQVTHPQMRLKFERDPLSCVLALSDVLQDFGRHDASFMRTRPKQPGNSLPDPAPPMVKYKSRCEEVRLEWLDTTGELKITYVYPNPSQRHDKREFARKEEVEYFDPAAGFVDMSFAGIRRITIDVAGS